MPSEWLSQADQTVSLITAGHDCRSSYQFSSRPINKITLQARRHLLIVDPRISSSGTEGNITYCTLIQSEFCDGVVLLCWISSSSFEIWLIAWQIP
ncbi:hypothetical protein CEXT_760551 [Caerostris extrusa]|uniref:Uncharacterized protein n=1 Tax=Caerostris extrusa TaxID=172846 RepID=A0AAV4VNQ4_CAEEX|nr:hypothetical protein CEXT_760551 [Caerostris extrusa]